MIYIKNISGLEKTFRGNVLANNTYHLIPDSERYDWHQDEVIFQDVANGDAQMCKDDSGSKDIESKTEQWCFLGNDGVSSI